MLSAKTLAGLGDSAASIAGAAAVSSGVGYPAVIVNYWDISVE